MTQPDSGKTLTSEQQLKQFLGKFDPRLAALIRAVRKLLRSWYPSANELVYDNYNFFVIGYSSTEKPSDCFVSIAAAAKGVVLSFYYGSKIKDPRGLLLGSGKQNRFIRLDSAATITAPEVRELIDTAVAQGRVPLPSTGKGKLIIRSISEKQRPRQRKEKG